MIIGTAGHIDHGKTTLVRALTGVDTDRLPEEKRRGITIDLGFAPLELPGVGTVGVVDVPGHEAFVRTMVAGAAGVDLALLVIAADEGVMPQTREHLAVLALLGVRHAVVALTKADLVDADWMALARDDVAAALAGTPFDGAPMVPVSAATGAGLDALRAALAAAARRVVARADEDLFRLPVDRAFTVRGTGTVVSGTVWSGILTRDASVRLMPADREVRVRGLHAFGRVVDAVRAGERAGIALAGVDVSDVGRGSVLVQGEAWRPSRVLRADVALLADAPRPVGPRGRLRLHLGTSDVGARLVTGAGPLSPGGAAPARVVTDVPLVARAGDRFVLRAESPVATIGGGVVSDPVAPPRARPWPAGERDARSTLARLLHDAGAAGVPLADLPVRLGVAPAGAPAIVAAVACWRVGERLVAASARATLAAAATSLLAAHHERHPLETGAPSGWLRAQLHAPEEVAAALLDELHREGEVVVEHAIVRLASFAPRLDGPAGAMAERVLATLRAAGREPPSIPELAERLGADAAGLLDVARFLARQGPLVAVEPDRFYLAAVVDDQLAALAAAMAPDRDHAVAELRDALGASRKFVVPFLEYCDRTGVTRRDGDGRRRWHGGRLPG